MNWYLKTDLIKLAAAKDKINSYGIADPFLKFFIHRYEKLIPWDKVKEIKKSGQDVSSHLQQYISSNLLPSLNSKINQQSDDNNFMKSSFLTDEDVINEIRHTEEAMGRIPSGNYSEGLIEKSRAEMLNDVNKEKQEQFSTWWNYMHEEEAYAQNPALQFSLLKPIIDSSPPDKKDAPPPLNAEVLAKIWDEINNKGVDQMNILKKYRKLAIKAEREKAEQEGAGEEQTEGGGRWLRIKGGPNVSSQAELKENMNRLKTLSQGTKWCTASGMANTYLPRGDFYLYLENDKAVVAIRCEGNKVVEIRGYNNKQKHLDPYWQEVINFLSTTDLDYQNNQYYKLLKDIELMNIKLERGTEKFNDVLKQIQRDHGTYLKLSDENKQFEEFQVAASIGYRAELEDILREVEKQAEEGEYLFQFDDFQNKYDKIPPEIKQKMPDLQERVFQAHKKAYGINPNIFSDFPIEIQQQFSPEEQDEGWRIYVDADPYHYNDDRIPGHVREQIDIDPLKGKLKILIKNNSQHLDHIGQNTFNLFSPEEKVGIANDVLQEFKIYPVSSVHGRMDKFDRIEKLVAMGVLHQQQVIDALKEVAMVHPEWVVRFPQQYKDEIAGEENISTAIEEEQKQHIVRDVGYFKSFNQQPDVQDRLLAQYGQEIGEAFGKTIGRYNGLLHNFWKSVPDKVIPYLPTNIIDQTAQYFANVINRNPSNQERMIAKLPDDIRDKVIEKLAFSKNWYKKAAEEWKPFLDNLHERKEKRQRQNQRQMQEISYSDDMVKELQQRIRFLENKKNRALQNNLNSDISIIDNQINRIQQKIKNYELV
jgi:hypothetical protein